MPLLLPLYDLWCVKKKPQTPNGNSNRNQKGWDDSYLVRICGTGLQNVLVKGSLEGVSNSVVHSGNRRDCGGRGFCRNTGMEVTAVCEAAVPDQLHWVVSRQPAEPESPCPSSPLLLSLAKDSWNSCTSILTLLSASTPHAKPLPTFPQLFTLQWLCHLELHFLKQMLGSVQ